MDITRGQFFIAIALALVWTALPASPESSAAKDDLSALDLSTLMNMDVVVTAQKREQREGEVGIAIAATQGTEMHRLGIRSSTDLASIAPGVSTAGSYGGQFLTFSIRGVTQNDFLDHTEAPNAVYMDEAYLAMMTTQQFPVFDMERAEILKGPQGTLFGRNSTGGTVNFVSRKPGADTRGFLDVSYGSFDETRVEGAAGGALSAHAQARAALLYNRSSPILTNDSAAGADLWNDDSIAGRVHLRFELSPAAQLLLTGYGNRTAQRSSPWQWSGTIAEVDAAGRIVNTYKVSPAETRECIGPGGANADCGNDVSGAPDGVTLTRPVPGGDFFGYREARGTHISQETSRHNVNVLSVHGGTANLHWTPGDLTLISVSDYKAAHKDFQLDGTASPARGINTIARAETDSYSQELRLMGSPGRWRWVGGLYYLDIRTEVPATGIWLPVDGDTPTIVAADLQGMQFLDGYALKSRSGSLFGQAEYSLTEKITAIAGLRATRERKDFRYRSDVYRQTNPQSARIFEQGTFVAPTRAYAGESSETLWSARAGIDFKPRSGALLYASINRGVKAGGFNAPFAGGPPIPDAQIPYGAETLTAYEVGSKTTFPGNRAQLNASAFYYDYRDYQTFQFIGLTSQVTNNNARYRGADAELTLNPARGLMLRLEASYLDTRVFDVASFGIVADKQAAFAPRLQANGLARYEWRTYGGLASLQASFNSSSAYYYSLTNFDALKAKGHTAFNGGAAFRLPGGRTELSVFVANLTDNRYGVLGFDLSAACGCSLAAYARPRTIEVSVNHRFGDSQL